MNTEPAHGPRTGRRLLQKTALALGAGLLVLLGVLVVNTVRFKHEAARVTPVAVIRVDTAAASRLAEAVRFATISHGEDAALDTSAFLALHGFLEQAFPRVHATLPREVFGGLSLLYTWPGQQPNRPPILLMAHQDVVPVEGGTEDAWTHPPFAGRVQDGHVWGRGTLDDKAGLLGILEAVEMLLADGFVPQQTVYLAFGHDEEVGGRRGAQRIAEAFAARGVRLDFVLDEGGFIIEDTLPGLDAPAAIIGTAEKGYLSLELSVASAGGHSSRPPRHTAVGIVSRAVSRLEAHPLPARLDGATAEMFEHVGPAMSFPRRLILANLWLFRPLTVRMLSAGQNTDATIRTTTAATMIRGGEKDNVLPTHATAVVNFRILPGETVESVTEHVRRTIDDPRVRLRTVGVPQDPTPVSSTASAAFEALERSIREVSPEDDLIVAPYLFIAGTDAKHFTALADDVYRFVGWKSGPETLASIHGADERIALDEYARTIRFYYRLLQNLHVDPEE